MLFDCRQPIVSLFDQDALANDFFLVMLVILSAVGMPNTCDTTPGCSGEGWQIGTKLCLKTAKPTSHPDGFSWYPVQKHYDMCALMILAVLDQMSAAIWALRSLYPWHIEDFPAMWAHLDAEM